MQLSSEELKKLQNVCLELACEVDRVCRKNNIEYTLEGGTLIGAVREHGFIAWDDDVDISMSRKEYEKFFEACKTDLNTDRFFLQEHRTDPEYPWGYAKLRMNGTSLVQIGQEDMLRAWYAIIDKIPKKWLFAGLDSLASSTNRRRTELMRHYTFPYFRKECIFGLPSHCFDSYIDADFEGKKLRIMKDYDTFLTLKYGDYMTPPPPSEITYYPISRIRFLED